MDHDASQDFSRLQPNHWPITGADAFTSNPALIALPAVVRHAYRLLREDQNTRACRLLEQALTPFDPVTAQHETRLIRAALQYVASLAFTRDAPHRAEIQLAWARYTRTAALTCYGEASSTWQDITGLYAQTCADQGLTFDAALTREQLVAAHRRYGPWEQIPEAWELLALALHADGQCDRARTEIHQAFSHWKHTGVPAQRNGGRLLRSYAGILAGCGDPEAARTLLTAYPYLVALPGAPDRETAAFIIAAHIAIAERDHPAVCTADPPPVPPSPARSVPAWQFWQTILLRPPHQQPALQPPVSS